MKASRPAQSRSLLWALTILLVFQAVTLSAQEGPSSIPVELAPTTIEVTGPWRQDAALSEASAEREVVVLSGTNDNLIIGFLPAATAGADPVATVLGAHAETIGPLTDVDRNTRYALQAAEIAGVPYGMFSLVYTNRNPGIVEVYIYLGPAATFNTGLASAQASVTIGGAPAFLRVNARTLQAMIVRATGPGDAVRDASMTPPLATTNAATPAPATEPAAPPTIAPTALPTVAPTSAPGPSPSTPIPASTTAPPAVSATPSSGDTVVSVSEIVPGLGTPAVVSSPATPVIPAERPEIDVSEYRDLGVQEDGYYVSPQFRTEIRWDARWTILQVADHSAVESNPVTRTDSLTLSSTQYPDVVVVITIMSAYDFGMDDWTVAMETRDEDTFPDVMSEVGERSGVVVLMSRDQLQVYMFDLATSADGSVFRETEVRTSPQLSAESLEAVTGGIQIDESPLFRDLPPGELEDAVS